ncbi:MAG: AAA family ATPase [Actinomycetota bacterium]|nr:AAA family ATPase [Actinomycetota bacterium]
MEGLLGRHEELGRLHGLLDEALGGHLQLALVGGDAGIGKTSLVAAFAAAAAEDAGAEVAWGRCWEGDGGAPFWPWVQILRACLDQLDDAVLADLGSSASDVAQLIPDVRTRVPGLAVTPTSDSPDARLRLFESVATFLGAAARSATGLVVVVDDFHGADEGSIRLLQYLARRGVAAPLVVVVTYRITEVVMSEVLTVAVDELARRGVTLRLRGLEADDVGTLLERAAPGVGRGDVARVHDATDGNPFLVYEAARLLAGAAPDRRGQVVLPADARALIHQRLAPVPAEQRAVLAAGAILGREFDLRPLSQVVGRPAGELIDVLSDAVELAVVEEVQLGRWSFTHALLREALLDELDSDRRAGLHRRAGEVLESIHGVSEGQVVVQIATHLHAAVAEGGDVSRAVTLCAQAARIANASLAYEEATRWYERALETLELMEPVDELRRYELLVAMAEVATRRGNVRASTAAHQRAIRAARALGSVELAARAAVLAAPLAVSDPLVIGALDDALCDLPEDDSPLRARVLVSFARVMSASYLTIDILLDVNQQGLEMARRIGDPETQWWTLWQWHQNAFPSIKTLEERHRVADELKEIADRSGDVHRRLLARQFRASNLVEDGDLAAADAELVASLHEAEDLRLPFHVWTATSALTYLRIGQGRLDEAEHLARRAAAMGDDLDWVSTDISFTAQLAHIRRHQGAFDEMARLALNALETYTVTGFDCARQFPALLALVENGHLAEARARLDKVLGSGVEKLFFVTDPEGNRFEWHDGRGCCRSSVAELSWLLGDRERAAPLYEWMLSRRGTHIVSGDGSRGAADRYLGQLATVLGRFAEADGHFEAAHRLHDRMGTPIWEAYGRLDHARMLELRDGPGDRARAAELLAEAAATFRRVGMAFFERRARHRLESLQAGDGALRLRKEGEYWAVAFRGSELRQRDSKGMRYLARLVANPGREIHAVELAVGEGRGTVPRERELEANGAGDAGTVLDAAAKAAYRRRLDDLRRDGRGPDVEREIAFLEAQLGAATGRAGRDRRAASDAERARQSVTKAVKEAVERLSEADATLGDHLRAAVRTGIYSSYTPT